ncbi:MAG: glycosyltransferase family 39 protein [Candidatus Margulisbacteria bacterium]|nr:glycosyltransferase family 39 protein [Candidatus Margulisiibacteriota bacterium]
MIKIFKKNRFLFIIGLLGFILIFTNLGNRYITGDEALTTTISKNIIDYGYPAARYDESGPLIIAKSGAYTEINGKDYYTWNSWLEYYLPVIPLKLFGLNEFALRLFFAVFGFLSIFLFYLLSKKITHNIRIVQISTLLLTLSVPFILHVRQIRWYSLVIFGSIWLLWSYLTFLDKRKAGSLHLILSTVFLFYSNFFILVAVVFCLAIHFFFLKHYKTNWKRLILPTIISFCLTFPWIVFTGQISSKGEYVGFSFTKFILNLVIINYYIFIFIFPLFLGLLFFFFKKKSLLKEFRNKNYLLILIFIIGYVFFLSLKMDGLPGIRYLLILIPPLSLVSGFIIYKIKEKNKFIAYALIILLIGTNFLHLFPFFFLKGFTNNINSDLITDYEKEHFIDNSLKVRYFFFDYLYEISHDYDSSDELIINYLQKYGSPEDTFIASDFPQPILLYTNMKMVDFNSSKVDWIVVRGFKVREDKTQRFIDDLKQNIDLSRYKTIIIDSLEERWAEAPDPANHRFETNKNGKIIIYHLKE